MGLHLCYRLILPGSTTPDDVRSRLDALRAFASTLDFERIRESCEYTADELVGLDDREIVKITASSLCAEPFDFHGLAWGERCVFAFLVLPGEKCESALFGFLAPGARVPNELNDDLHPGEWFWSSCCKTQYASTISDAHLLKCHDGLVRVLEHAATLGITVEVEDETGYWEHRSAERLFAAVRRSNRLIARLAGALSDRGHEVEAPIFDHPEFERLEMEALPPVDQADGCDPGSGA